MKQFLTKFSVRREGPRQPLHPYLNRTYTPRHGELEIGKEIEV